MANTNTKRKFVRNTTNEHCAGSRMARRTAGKRGVVVEITSTRLSEEQRSHARKMRSAKRRKSSYKGHTADA